MALPQAAAGSRGDSKSEEEKALAVSYIRRRVSVAAVKGQRLSLLGRLEVLGPGTVSRCRQKEVGPGPGAEVEEGPTGNAPQREAGEEHP